MTFKEVLRLNEWEQWKTNQKLINSVRKHDLMMYDQTVASKCIESWFNTPPCLLYFLHQILVLMSHLCSEDTDAVHPHWSNCQTFIKESSKATFQLLHSVACCCRWHPSPGWLLLPVRSPLCLSSLISLLPLSCDLHLSFHQSNHNEPLC